MKYLKIYENFKDDEIHQICMKFGIENYTINVDGSIDVDGDVNIFGLGITKLPLKFKEVGGSFDCSSNHLLSLEGGPQVVGGNFLCYDNKLSSLEGGPKEVGGDFNCGYNKLSSLEGCPKEVGGGFYCYNNQLTTLEGCPNRVGGFFSCSYNNLLSLKGCPKEVGGDFNCSDNHLLSLEGGPQKIGGNFSCSGTFYKIWKLISPDDKWDNSIMDLFNDYDCVRGTDIIIDRFNEFLIEIGKDPVESVEGYKNI